MKLGIWLIVLNVSLKLYPAFQNTEAAFERWLTNKSSCSAKWCEKQERVMCKFTKNWTPAQIILKKFDYRLGTAILKKTSWWPPLWTIVSSEHSWMSASQRQLRRYIYFKQYNGYAYVTFFTVAPCLRVTNNYGCFR